VRKLVVGNGIDPKTHVGPSVSKKQEECVLNHIQIGKGAGVEIAAQRNLPSDLACKNRFFVPPTIFKSVTCAMEICARRGFWISSYSHAVRDEEAVPTTNELKYGLVSYVYTRGHEKAQRISRKIDAVVVFLNNKYRLPLVMRKVSGYRGEHCIETLRE
jgi:acyl-CoA reductase-like NAD-dependent aldehyde dehydrogenase